MLLNDAKTMRRLEFKFQSLESKIDSGFCDVNNSVRKLGDRIDHTNAVCTGEHNFLAGQVMELKACEGTKKC